MPPVVTPRPATRTSWSQRRSPRDRAASPAASRTLATSCSCRSSRSRRASASARDRPARASLSRRSLHPAHSSLSPTISPWTPQTGAPHDWQRPIAKTPHSHDSVTSAGPSWYRVPQEARVGTGIGWSYPTGFAISSRTTEEVHSQYPGAMATRAVPPQLGQGIGDGGYRRRPGSRPPPPPARTGPQRTPPSGVQAMRADDSAKEPATPRAATIVAFASAGRAKGRRASIRPRRTTP